MNQQLLELESFRARIARYWQQYADDINVNDPTSMNDTSAVIASNILGELGIEGDAFAVLHLCVKEGVRHVIRDIEKSKLRQRQQQPMTPQLTRRYREKRERAGSDVTVHRQSVPTPDLKNPLAFLEMKAPVNGVYKLWKHFTLEELESRRLTFAKSAKIASRIERSNAWAIEICQQHQASCLAEIDEGDLIDELPDEEIVP